jgi:hypothetical protein
MSNPTRPSPGSPGDGPRRDGRDLKPVRGWDYSSHPLEAGGMQIVTVIVGTLVSLLLIGVLVLVGLFLYR